jgi:hypothetical protein
MVPPSQTDGVLVEAVAVGLALTVTPVVLLAVQLLLVTVKV